MSSQLLATFLCSFEFPFEGIRLLFYEYSQKVGGVTGSHRNQQHLSFDIIFGLLGFFRNFLVIIFIVFLCSFLETKFNINCQLIVCRF